LRRFAFNLEPVLQYRTRREEEAVAEQADAERRRRQKEEVLARTRAALDDSLAGDRAGGVAELLHLSVYRTHLEHLADHQADEVRQATREWAVCRERTLVRHQERLILEKLKEKREAVFFQELAVREQKENDEISLRLHTARREGNQGARG